MLVSSDEKGLYPIRTLGEIKGMSHRPAPQSEWGVLRSDRPQAQNGNSSKAVTYKRRDSTRVITVIGRRGARAASLAQADSLSRLKSVGRPHKWTMPELYGSLRVPFLGHDIAERRPRSMGLGLDIDRKTGTTLWLGRWELIADTPLALALPLLGPVAMTAAALRTIFRRRSRDAAPF